MSLTVENLTKKYGNKTVLNNITATFKEGKCYLLLGENGSGKSTLARCLSGDEPYHEGSIYFHENAAPSDKPIILQYQTFDSYPYLKVKEVIKLFRKLVTKPFDTDELEEILDISSFANTLMKNTSGGQRKAVSILVAFLLHKPYILLDEPFADLDLHKKQRLAAFLQQQVQQNNQCLVIISHEIAGLEEIFDYIYILKNGTFIEQGSNTELLQKYPHNVFPGLSGVYFEVTGKTLKEMTG
ncbi:ATP-binding cassette domain-containing protein [Oceanobacillus jeddahense]|uniref:ABC transporter ATP-binding protein n=1 Tax=Oceanobacillus jeddahense TaxID=1462527 RepID=A0ABY5JV33_9BACI|nr:ABC transporter ATP-binding protein [Oceanobacillus jeddahense]UUI03625.1 ABC transporter ATP-binding protein [Oceanobacillus jeddahense]